MFSLLIKMSLLHSAPSKKKKKLSFIYYHFNYIYVIIITHIQLIVILFEQVG